MNDNTATVAVSIAHHTLVVLGLTASLWLLYQQSFSFDYVYFDDNDYVLENPVVLEGLTWDNLGWAMTSFQLSNWHPLTWMSHMLDVTLFGSDPGPAHAHNTLLHGINSLLVYSLLIRIGASLLPAALLTLIFLVHPLHVESVAWIAERKDLLCGVFYLLCLLLYDKFRSDRRMLWYMGALACAVLALMAKPMAVSLPVIMVLMDLTLYRKPNQGALPELRTVTQSVLGKLPLIAITAGACVLTVLAQDGNQAIAYLQAHSLTDRLETASGAYFTYLQQWLVPINLVAYYPMDLQGTVIAWLLPSLAVLALSGAALALWKRWPLITLGWAWYLVTLLPVIGLVQVGSQAHADRYMYIPSIGLLLIAAAVFPAARSTYYRSAVLVTGAFSVFLIALSYWQIATWKNQYTVFSRVLDLEGPNYKAHIHLAGFYLRHQQLDEAETHATQAIAMAPALSDGYQALGNVALGRRQFAQAENYFRQAIAAGPEIGAVFNNLGIALAQQNRSDAAKQAFKKAVEINPSLTVARKNLQTQIEKLQAKP